MTELTNLPGIKKATNAQGRVYFYHRASGVRLKSTPENSTAFLAEVAALDALAGPAPDKPADGTLGGLIRAYKASPEWTELSADTHKCYQRVFNELKVFDGLNVANITSAHVLAIRDRAFAKHKRWLANMAVKVLSVLLGFAVPRGLADTNVAKGVPTIRRSRQLGIANAGWTWAEISAALDASTGGLRKAIALAYFTGMRKKDVCEVRRAEYRDGRIERVSSKPGAAMAYYVPDRLAAILSEPDAIAGLYLVATRLGRPYTRDGLDTQFHRLKVRLVEAGKVRHGLTFHGIRKSLGKDAADEGFSENDIAGALGQLNPASARPYTVERNQRDASERVMKALERKGKR